MAALVAGAAARPASACTTFMLERGGDRVVGKSYDWHMGQGLVLVNKRGVAKQSLPAKPDDSARPLAVAPRERDVQPVRPRVSRGRHERRRSGGRGDVAGFQHVRTGRWPPDAERAAVDPVPAGQLRDRRGDDHRGARTTRVAGLRARSLSRVRQVRRLRRVRAHRRQAGRHPGRPRAHQSPVRRIGRVGVAAETATGGCRITGALRARRPPSGVPARRRPR